MNKVGIIGWRGMVGSVLVQRMRDEGDFAVIEPTFFTTQLSMKAPDIGKPAPVKDSNNIAELKGLEPGKWEAVHDYDWLDPSIGMTMA